MQDITSFIQHHWILNAGLFVVLFLLIMLEFIKLKRSATRLSPTQVIQFINHQNAVIVDIRSPEIFASGHIVGALSIPFSDFENKLKKIEKLKVQPIILVCATGAESLRAATTLEKRGFNVHILNGGIRNWRAADMPLVKE